MAFLDRIILTLFGPVSALFGKLEIMIKTEALNITRPHSTCAPPDYIKLISLDKTKKII